MVDLYMVTHQSGISNKHPKVHINPKPSSRVSGICIEHTFFLLVYKMHSIQKEASHFLSSERVSIKALASFIGMLVASKPTVYVDMSSSLSCPVGREHSVTSLASFLQELSESVRGGTSKFSVVAVRLSSHFSALMLRLKA